MNKGIYLSEWEPFNLYLHCTKVDAYRFFENGQRTILFCHMLSRDHIIKWTCDFVRGSSSTKVITDSTLMLTGLKKLEMNVPNLSRNVIRSCDQISYDLVGGSPSSYVNTTKFDA